MKNFIAFLISAIVLIMPIQTSFANEIDTEDCGVFVSQEIEYFEDGTSAIISVYEQSNNSRAIIRTGTKTYTYRDTKENPIWTFSVRGTFSVNSGVSATCTSSVVFHSIVDDAWACKTSSASKSGNTAKGTATFIKKVAFITTDTKDVSVTLKCDKNGNFS